MILVSSHEPTNFGAYEVSHERADSDKRQGKRCFIGGSDARIIMGDDEAALTRLWREKRGEVEPEDLSGNLVVQLGVAGRAKVLALRRERRAPSPVWR